MNKWSKATTSNELTVFIVGNLVGGCPRFNKPFWINPVVCAFIFRVLSVWLKLRRQSSERC